MAGIQEYLDKIKNAVYGREVRQAIHDGIEECYKDGKAGAVDLVAREQIAELVAPSGEAPSAAEVTDARIGADGTTYTSLGLANRTQFDELKNTAFLQSYVSAKGTKTINGLTFTDLDGVSVKIAGTSTASTNYVYFENTAGFPAGIKNGDKISAWLDETTTSLSVQIFAYLNNGWSILAQISNPTKNLITIPAAATGLMVRIRVGSGVTLNETVTPHIIKSGSDEEKLYNMILGSGGKYYNVKSTDNLAAALIEATAYGNSTVFVESGTHDFITELQAIYGDSYFDDFSASSAQHFGVEIGNGINVVMSSNAKITFNYTGANTAVHQYFSPLMLLNSDVMLTNVTIECSNCKYAVHDDPVTKTGRYSHIYNDCHFDINNQSANQGDIVTWQAIGGGFGNEAYIEINGGFFRSIGNANNGRTISYHNCVNAYAKSNVNIKNAYCETGTIVASYYGASERMSEFMVSGCRVKSAPYRARESSSYDTVNINLKSWGNIVE